jgi:hypothetical protein
MDFKLTPSQEEALDIMDKFLKSSELTCAITGSAGTGKTTLISQGKKLASGVAVAAPTHKAKAVIAQKSDIPYAYTAAELVGLSPDTDIADFNPNEPKFRPKNEPKIQLHNTFFMDEASMINGELYSYLTDLAERYDTRIIFIGDRCQLPPVKEAATSKALTEPLTKYELTDIVRQQPTNPLSYLLLALRMDIITRMDNYFDAKTFGQLLNTLTRFGIPTVGLNAQVTDYFRYCLQNIPGQMNGDEGWQYVRTPQDYKDLLMQELENVDTFRALAYTNPKVGEYNDLLRSAEFPQASDFIVEGDRLMGYRTVKEGPGKADIMTNSCDYIVLSAEDDIAYENSKPLKVRKVIMKNDQDKRSLIKIIHPESHTAYNAIMADAYWNAKKNSSYWKEYFRLRDLYQTLEDHAIEYNNNALPYKSIDYRYAITCHKSQGSTFDSVGVDGKNISSVLHTAIDFTAAERQIVFYKLLYVAISRAAKKAILYF